jgi:hypothetical protein
MIQLNPDCLIFQTSNGEQIPCSAELVTIELMGETASLVDPEVIRNASAAVLHYFKHELGRTSVSVAEFSSALEKVLRGFGFDVKYEEPQSPSRVIETDLRELAAETFELSFFLHLRDDMRRKLDQRPQVLRFKGLRGCVKQLVGAKRWCPRCQGLNDQIVEFLRTCLTADVRSDSCALVVQA